MDFWRRDQAASGHIRPGEQQYDRQDRRGDHSACHPRDKWQQLARSVEPVERGHKLAAVRVARGGVLLETPRDQRRERFGNGVVNGSHRRKAVRDALLHRVEPALRRGIDNRAGTGQHLVDDQTERIHVRSAVYRRASGLFRRHVFERADDAAA